MHSTIVYIDGFNLYYGCLAGTSYKWLDPLALCKALLTNNDITRIKYFTARVSARAGDPSQPQRQQTYIRALLTIPNLEIHYGHFLSHPKMMPLAHPQPGYSHAKVISTQEKGSDVNLASHLLLDAFRRRYEIAALITNDSDLYTPAKMVKEEFGKKVAILNPHADNSRSQPSRQLREVANIYKSIRYNALASCQFPAQLTDSKGTFHKPAEW